MWDPSVKSDGFKGEKTMTDSSFSLEVLTGTVLGFAQKRFINGTFANTSPVDCSPNDNSTTRSCSLQGDNVVGFYESSSWEYSW